MAKTQSIPLGRPQRPKAPQQAPRAHVQAQNPPQDKSLTQTLSPTWLTPHLQLDSNKQFGVLSNLNTHEIEYMIFFSFSFV